MVQLYSAASPFTPAITAFVTPNADGTLVISAYAEAKNVTDWTRVLAVRSGMLLLPGS